MVSAQRLHVAKKKAAEAQCKMKELNDFMLPKYVQPKQNAKRKCSTSCCQKYMQPKQNAKKKRRNDFPLPKMPCNCSKMQKEKAQ
jgi:hypothetical protein